MQNLGDLGANGGRGSKFLIENVIFGTAEPDLPIQLCNFYGATMMIKGSLLLSAPTLSFFSRSLVLGQNLMILGDKWWFNIKFNFYNPKKAHPFVISRL